MAQTFGIPTSETKGVKFQEFSSVSALPNASTYGDGFALINDSIYKSDGTTWQPWGLGSAATLAEVGNTPGVTRVNSNVVVVGDSGVKKILAADNYPLSGDEVFVVTGDSTSIMGRSSYYYSATISKQNAQNLFAGDCQQDRGAQLLGGGTGSLSYRASDQSFRWAAPGDVATSNYGAWVQILPGTRNVLESGSPNCRLALGNNNAGTDAASDWTVSVTLNGVTNYANSGNTQQAIGAGVLRALGIDEFGDNVKTEGVGGLYIEGALASLPKLNSIYIGNVTDIISLGANDIPSSDVADINAHISGKLAKYQQYIESRLPNVSRMIWLGFKGKVITGTYNSVTTPLTSHGIAAANALCNFLQNCEKKYSNFYYVDCLADFVDPAYTNYRYKIAAGNWVMQDQVHQSIQGGQLVAAAAKAKLSAKGVNIFPPPINKLNTQNLLTDGWLDGASGAISGTGVSGTAPNILINSGNSNFSGRVDAVNTTAVLSVVDRPISSTYADKNNQGKAVKIVLNTGASESTACKLTILGNYNNFRASDFASYGISAGDVIKMGFTIDKLTVDLYAAALRPNANAWTLLGGETQAPRYWALSDGDSIIDYARLLAFNGPKVFWTPWFKLPADFSGTGKHLFPVYQFWMLPGITNGELYLGPILLQKK